LVLGVIKCKSPCWSQGECGNVDTKACLMHVRRDKQTLIRYHKPPVSASEIVVFTKGSLMATTNELDALFNLTDLGNGERFAQRYQEKVCWCHTWKQWLIYNGAYWEKDEHSRIGKLAKDVVRAIYAEAGTMNEKENRTKVASHAIRSESNGAISAMLDRAKSELGVSPAQFNTQLHLLNCRNGTVNLETGELLPHNPADFITRCVDASYKPDADCPRWEKFIDTIFDHDAAMVAFIQQALGMSLSGSIQEQVFFLCHGVGSNGKTTMLEVARRILWLYAKQANIETFMVRKQEGISNDRAELYGARLVNASEMKLGSRLNEALIKKVTGGEPERARFLNSNEFEYMPEYTLWLAVNHVPEIKDTTNSIWRRVMYIPFTVVFEENHTDPEKRIDPTLLQKLMEEKDGIFTWMVQGHMAWKKAGRLVAPQAVIDATSDYRAEMDTIGIFLQECCTTGKNLKVQAKYVYDAYKDWCVANGNEPVSLTEFGKSITEHGYIKKKADGKVQYQGITLVDMPASAVADTMFTSEKPKILDTVDTLDTFPRDFSMKGFEDEKVEKVSKVSTVSTFPQKDGTENIFSLPVDLSNDPEFLEAVKRAQAKAKGGRQ
jgi:putative DNA primase/helicase